MITILRGSTRQLSESSDRRVGALPTISLVPASPRCWNGIRNLLAVLRARRGDAAVDAVLARHRPVAGRVPGVLSDERQLTDADKLAGDRLGALQESHLSHNLLVQAHLFDAWAALLNELLADVEAPLAIADLARLDRESLTALRALFRRFPASAPSLIAGYDPNQITAEPDMDGLIWDNPAEDIHRVALAFAARDGNEIIELADSDERLDGSRVTAQLSVMAPTVIDLKAVDHRAFTALSSHPENEKPDETTCKQVIAAMQASFACFGFTTALRLGLELLAKRPRLSASQAAELHGIIVLAAHNRQFRSRGNRDLASFLTHHLEQALAAENRSDRRSCLCYRLAVTHGRRRKDFAAGLDWAGRAIAESRGDAALPPWQRAHLEGWARNIRAYVLMGLGRLAEANDDCEVAFNLLDRALMELDEPAVSDPDPLIRETAYTHSLLADNLAALAKMRDDMAGFARWKEIADQLAVAVPGLARFEAILWIDLYRQSFQLELARPKAQAGLDAARVEQDPLREHTYTVQLADLCYRLGDADRALELLTEAAELRRRLGEPAILRAIGPVSATMVALRAAQPERARHFLDEIQTSTANVDARAQIFARLGWSIAASGATDLAEDHLNQAITLAVDSGQRDTLMDVAVMAGRTAQLLGRPREARDAYLRALELATVGELGEEAPAPSPALLMAVQLGLGELGDAPDERPLRALELLPAALADADAWWDLHRLLFGLASVVTEAPEELATESLGEPLRLLRIAADQRQDCRPFLDHLPPQAAL